MPKLKIPQAINQLNRLLKAHIGSDGSAHLTATKTSNGFLSASDKIRYDGAVGERILIDAGGDILTLEPGKYQGIKLQNSAIPETNSTYQNIDVSIGQTLNGDTLLTRKMYRIQTTLDGKIWERSIHQNGADTGWRQVVLKELLWSGTFKSGSITLPKALSVFETIKVEYTEGNAGYRVEEFGIRTEFNLSAINVSNGVGTVGGEISECRITISGSVLTIAHNRKLSLNFANSPAGGGDITETEAITISKIWGLV